MASTQALGSSLSSGVVQKVSKSGMSVMEMLDLLYPGRRHTVSGGVTPRRRRSRETS